MFFILSIISQWVWLTTRFSNAARIDDFPMETSMQQLGISLFFSMFDDTGQVTMINHVKPITISLQALQDIIFTISNHHFLPTMVFVANVAKIRAVSFRISCNSHGLAVGGGHPPERERDSTYKYERTYKIL